MERIQGSLIHSFILFLKKTSFNGLDVCHVSGTELGAGCTVMDKACTVLALIELIV